MIPRWLKWGLGTLAIALIAIQFIPTSRTNPPIESDIPAPPAVKAILRRSCYDCHSNETVWPKYARIAPGSFLIANDVTEGRAMLNFSEWDRRPPAEQRQKIEQMLKEIREGEMPPWYYLPLHPKARLTDADKATLEAWATEAPAPSTATTTLPLTPAEKKYLDARDAAAASIEVKYKALEKSSNGNADAMTAEDKAALAALQPLIREAVGPVRVEGFSGAGESNLETLVPEVGFGREDGVRFENGKQSFLATTANLVRFDAIRGETPELKTLAEGNGAFYSMVMDSDVAYTNFSEIPVKGPASADIARAYLMLCAQDIGPFLPDTIMVFLSKGDRVLIGRIVLPKELPAIDACTARWNEGNARSDVALKRYQTSQDQKDFEESRKIQDDIFEEYAACWRDSAKSQPFFGDLTRQAQSLIDRLAPALSRR